MPADSPRRATIVDLTHDGKGVADVDGQRVFVAGALPGEDVQFAARKRRRRFEEAQLVNIVTPGPERVAPACLFFGRCGGCAIQHMSYDAQLSFKQSLVEQTFARIGGVTPRRWLEPQAGAQWHYRRRARLGVRFVEAKGRALVGFRERASQFITDMDHCPVLVRPIDEALGELARIVGASSSPRRIPQVEVAIGDASGAIVVRMLDAPADRDERLFGEFGRRLDLDVYFQTAGPGSIRPIEPPVRQLYYKLAAFDLRLDFMPTDFIQVNAAINEAMVSDAVERAQLTPGDRVLDLYCGLGNFSLPFARESGTVLGVEGDAGLVARAAHNAALNNLDNTSFLTADLMHADWPFLHESWDVVVLDPPRTGAGAIAPQMKKLAPRRIIYVSCHPATLARDARTLCESQGYRLDTVRIFDMFPNTHHVEVMAVFDRHA